MTLQRVVLALGFVAAVATGCRQGPADASVADSLRVRLQSIEVTQEIRGERLLAPKTVGRFYKQHPTPAWGNEGAIEQVLDAIRDVEKDGLSPEDYHRKAVEDLLARRGKLATAGTEADLDVLLTDAVAGLADHLRYGRVHPVTLNAAWNADPRDGAPPLDSVVAAIASSRSPGNAIADQRPQHFIYKGLVGALASLREIESKGGWPRVPDGPSIKPGARDRRVPVVRRRLTISGDLGRGEASDSTLYDDDLAQAVKMFQQRHRLLDDEVVDRPTIEAMNVSAGDRAAQVRVNLERARWVLNGLQDDFLLVNLPAFKCYLIRGGKNEWEARTQIGQEARQTPTFRSTLRTIVFNPDWTVPPTILEQDVLAGMRKGQNMIAKKRLVITDAQGQVVDPSSIDWKSATPGTFPYTLRQPAGPGAALGHVKFEFPNPYSIYLHDTPSRELFASESRTFSSGCIRLERPVELAERLLQGQDGGSPEQIQKAIDSGETQRVKIERPLPVLIVYWTVSVGASGEVRYTRDVYDLDPPVRAALDGPARAIAEGGLVPQPKVGRRGSKS